MNSQVVTDVVEARNAAFAASERIAFACCCTGTVEYRDAQNPQEQHAVLATAREQLHGFVVLRLRELQLLTHWPLARSAKAPDQLNNLRRADPTATPWSLIGDPTSPLLDLPSLPELLRKHLWGPTELLLALAGQLGKGDVANSSTADQGYPNGSRAVASLPRTLGLVTFMPALQSLTPPSLDWLRGFFADLRPQHRHVGVDDRHHPWFKELKLHAARSLLKEGSAQMCRSFLRFGAPHGARAALWEAALCLAPLTQQDIAAFASLCCSVQAQHSLLDVCICDDLRSIADSEHFFLFEEMLRAVVLALSRDWQLPLHTPIELQPNVVSVAAALASAASAAGAHGSMGSDTGALASLQPPPCSLLLPQGTAMLAAPLCYLMEHPAAVYRLFRSMFTRYWCKLHTLQPLEGNSPTLPMLVKMYEQLLQELDPDVVSHVHGTGLPIAALATPWLCSAFSGHLPMEELLLLWDRVLGIDSLLPVPLLAVAVICFRRQAILACQSSAELLEVTADITQLRTIPLLQAVLFAG